MESTDETALEDFCKNFKSANAQEHQENKNDKLRRQGPRFSIRMVIGIFCSDTETGAVTPPGVMQKK